MARRISVEILGDSSSLERAFRRSSSAAGGFNRDIGRAGRGIASISLGYRGLARSVAFASSAFVGTAGLTLALKDSIQGFTSFQAAMQRSVGLANVSQKSVAAFSKQVLALAPVVGKSPQELANAFYFVASSGIAASKSMDVVAASAKASAAGLGETQVIADAVTSAMNAYGPSVLSAQKATDILVATVRQGKGEASAFAGVIGNVTALAAQLGVGFNDVGAALAAMTRLGTDAETASTQLQRVFTSLVKVTPQQAEAFKSVGLNADVLRQQLGTKGLLFVLDEIRKAFGNNIPAIEKAFGDIRAFRGVIALVGKQASSTRQIFKDMADTTGSLQTAFGAISQTSQQQFNKLKASAQVLGVAVGAIFAPLAGEVAGALAGAANQLTGFFDKLGRAQTFDAKINVVVSGLEHVAASITNALGAAIAAVDWNAVWSHARGIADGLQRRIDQINWSSVGSAIGDGIATGVAGATRAFKELAVRVEAAVASINFEQLGIKLGPALAAAVVSAFATLTDPSFWARHWQLALAVGVTVFSDGIGRLAGKFLGPVVRLFGRLGEEAALTLAGGFARLSDRLGTAVLAGLLRLPGLVGRALGFLVAPVRRVFDRLGRIARFVVKVLGVDAAIRVVTHAVSQLARLIGHGLDAAWRHMEIAAIHAALVIVEPFSHLPGFLGGGPFQRMKAALQEKLDQMEHGARKAALGIGTAMAQAAAAAADAARSINASIGESAFAAVGAAVKEVGGSLKGLKVPKQTVPQPQSTAGADGAQKLASTAKSTVQQGFVLPFRLQLAEAKASATATISDDLRVAREIRSFILKAIPHLHGQKLIDAYNQLGQINQQIADNVKQAATAGKNAGKAFAEPLRLQLADARAQALGLDETPILRKMKAAALKAIRSGKLSIQGQIDAWNEVTSINSQLQSSAKTALGQFKQLNTRKLTAGLNLTPEQRAALRARLSQIGPGGTVPGQGVGAFGFAINDQTNRPIIVKMDGKKVGQGTGRHRQKAQRRNSTQTRGPNAGVVFDF